ncbi:MAG: Gfo/Idh/MocA family oxidoreductase, partial [Actinocrinis sp.]
MTSAKTPLRVGLIGLGAMGRHHARVLRALDGVDLVAAADLVGDVHGVLGDIPLVPDVERLLEHRLDYAVVVCPTAHHERVGLALA